MKMRRFWWDPFFRYLWMAANWNNTNCLLACFNYSLKWLSKYSFKSVPSPALLKEGTGANECACMRANPFFLNFYGRVWKCRSALVIKGKCLWHFWNTCQSDRFWNWLQVSGQSMTQDLSLHNRASWRGENASQSYHCSSHPTRMRQN